MSGLKVTGLREAVRALERAGADVADLKAAFTKIGRVVVGRAERSVPGRTGALSASIRASRTKNKAVVRAGSARVPYAGINNYGANRLRTRSGSWVPGNYPASGFLTNAANRDQDEYLRILRGEIDRIIAKNQLG